MRKLIVCGLAVMASGFAFTASADCETPKLEITMPDGKTATRDQMVEAQGKVKAYQASMDEYLACLDRETTAQGEDAPAEFKALMVERHNAAVTEMQNVATAFNDQIKAFRAANP